jgi:hypothetical protein
MELLWHTELSENAHGRIPNGHVLASESKPASLAIYLKNRDIVAALIAAVKELAGRIEGEAAGIIPTRPFFAK